MPRPLLTAAALAAFALSACDLPPELPPVTAPASAAEEACARDVARFTGVPEVGILATQPTETGGTLVQVAVGEDRVAWQCVATPNGRTSAIRSLAGEGTL